MTKHKKTVPKDYPAKLRKGVVIQDTLTSMLIYNLGGAANLKALRVMKETPDHTLIMLNLHSGEVKAIQIVNFGDGKIDTTKQTPESHEDGEPGLREK